MAFVDIGPECFADADLSVISYKGRNYYRACDAFVSDLPNGGQSFCVKRSGHPGDIHEDFDGRIRIEGLNSPMAVTADPYLADKKCFRCKTIESPWWWKCCPEHTPYRSDLLACQSCRDFLHPNETESQASPDRKE